MQKFVAVTSLLLVVFLSVLPWGLSETGRLGMALLPGVVIFYWCARPLGVLSAPSVFFAGLFMDVLSGYALGYWALVYLCGYGAAVLLWRFDVAVFGVRAVAFPGVVLAMLGVACGLEFIVVGASVALWPVLGAFGLVVLAYPVLFLVLRFVDEVEARVEGRL